MCGCEYASLCEIRTKFVPISVYSVQFVRFIVALLHLCSPFLHWCLAHFSLSVGRIPRVVARHSPPHPAPILAPGPCAAARAGERGGPRHRSWTGSSEAGSECSEASRRSERTSRGHSEPICGVGHTVREVVVPMPSCEDLGTAHLDPPPSPGHPRPQAAGSYLDAEGGARARLCGNGISLPCGTWPWRPGGCKLPSASPSPPPLWSWAVPAGGRVCLVACERALAGADGGGKDWRGRER